MVVFNDPVPAENPALQAVLMALEVREAIGALTETWRRWGHDIGFGIGKPPPGRRRISRIPPRAIIVHGRPTSIRLEAAFWQMLREVAMQCGMTTKAVIEAVVAMKGPAEPLSSARVPPRTSGKVTVRKK